MQSFGRPINMNSSVPGPILSPETPKPEEPEAFGRAISTSPFTPNPKASDEQTSDEKSFGRPLNLSGSLPLPEQTAEKVPAEGLAQAATNWVNRNAENRANFTTEDYLTKPLTETVLGLPGTWSRKGAGPIEAGVEKGMTGFLSGLTTPTNLGLMIATGGLGALAEGLGADGVAAVAPELAPKIANAARVAEKLTTAGFTGEQLWNVSQKAVPQFYIAAKNGNTEAAAEALTNILLGGAAAAMSTAHLVGEAEPRWTAEKETIGAYQNQVEAHNIVAKHFARQNAALIKNVPLDMAARLYHEAGGDVNTLEQWRSEVANDSRIKPAVRDKYEGLLKTAQNLPDSVKALSARLRVDYEADWKEAIQAQKKDPNTPGVRNYAGQHTYEPQSEGDSTMRPVSARITKNPGFMKSRTFPTFIDALKAGFIPKDVGLAAARADYIRQFGVMKGAIAAENAMLRQTADDGRPVAVSPGAVRQLGSKRVLYLGTEKADEPAVPFKRVTTIEPSAKGYVYHATNEDNAVAIAEGQLEIHKPWEGTDQEAWPDGSIAKRAYFTPTAEHTWQFAPEEGKPVLLRVAREDGAFKRESTGDIYTTKPVPASKIDYLGSDNAWHPLTDIAQKSEPAQIGANLSRFDPSDIIRKGDKRYLDISDYVKAKPPFERYKWTGNDEYGDPAFQKAPVLIHPGYADKINKAFDTDSWFRKTPVMNAALKASTEAKKTLLSLSPFHYTTEYLRGLQMGLDPVTAFSPPELTPDRLAVQIGTKYGLTLLGDNAARTMTAEGLAEHAGLLNRVPGLGPMLNGMENHLFGDWIPRLKAEVWERLVPQLERRHPEWTDAQRYELASKITNAAFGGLNWKQLGWSLGSTDFLRLIALAPDFTGSQLAFAKYGMQPGGSIVWQSFARIAAYNFAVAQTLNLLFNGKVRLDRPFSVQDPKDKTKVISIRTMPADIFHALTDPRSFAMNRMNPLTVRSAWELGTGRDIRGQKVGAERQLVDLLRNVTPISLQNFVPAFRYPDERWYQSGLRAVGLGVSQDVSPALQKARELARDRAPGAAMDSSELSHYKFKLQVEAALSNGTLKPAALSQLVAQDKLTRKEARQIAADVRETQGMNPLVGQLFLKVKPMPFKDALQVWDLSDNQERRALLPLMRKKRITYRQEAYRNLTARERQKDPTFQRTQEETFPQ